MTGQPWLVGQVVPEEFFGFCNLFLTKEGRQKFFWPPGGHATSENISRVLKMFQLFMFMFLRRHFAALTVTLGRLLICKAQLLEINRAPTAG